MEIMYFVCDSKLDALKFVILTLHLQVITSFPAIHDVCSLNNDSSYTHDVHLIELVTV